MVFPGFDYSQDCKAERDQIDFGLQPNEFNFKLNPLKTDLCAKDFTWCGRNISAERIKYNADMIESLPEQENVANFQKFLFGTNRIHASIPEYTSEVAPLQELLGEIMRTTGSVKGLKLRSIQLK